jgi:hypothetical protein
MDVRDELIGRVVAGASFADVGGLWGTVNEKVSVAHAHGARSLSMIDLSADGSHWWTAFDARCKSMNLPTVECVSGDIVAMTQLSDHAQYDVVHCSGVLYHLPDQMRLLVALRKLARRHVVLTSVVTPTRIENEAGVFEIPECGAIFVPALADRDQAIVRAHWRQALGDVGAVGLTTDLPKWSVSDYAPWWWIPTIPTLFAMCTASGFTVVDAGASWNGYAATILLEVENTQDKSAAA